MSAAIAAALAAATHTPAQPSWADAPLTDLMGHIVNRYHGKLRDLLPMLSQLGGKVINAHGDRHPEVKGPATGRSDTPTTRKSKTFQPSRKKASGREPWARDPDQHLRDEHGLYAVLEGQE